MPSIAQTPFDARFLATPGQAQLAKRIARAFGFSEPSQADIDSATALVDALPDLPANRAGKRASRAMERRSTEPPPTPRKGLSRAEVAKRAHERRQDTAYRAELDRRSVDWAPPPVRVDSSGKAWRPVPSEVWRMKNDLVSCTSSRAWRYWARRVGGNKVALGALRRAALLPRADGSTRRSFGSETARRIAALGFALLMFAKHTARKGPWSHVVRGIPVAVMQALCTYPDGSRMPCENTIIGHHRGLSSELERGQLGYLRALEAVGFMRSQRFYPDAADWETGRLVTCKDGRSFRAKISRYWLIGDPPMKAQDPELLALEREGWLALDEPLFIPRRAARTEPATPAPS